MKKLLYKCCVVLEQLKPETHADSLSLALILHTLVAYTSPNSWAILKSKQLAGLKPGMQQICSNILGDLILKGFYLTLRVISFLLLINYALKYYKMLSNALENSLKEMINFTIILDDPGERHLRPISCHSEANLINCRDEFGHKTSNIWKFLPKSTEYVHLPNFKYSSDLLSTGTSFP
jgi:hypothetical protein